MAQRGHTSIYKNLFDEPVGSAAPETPQPTIREKKVECILETYYYYGRKETTVNGKPVRMNYTALLEVVAANFFISTITLHDIVSKNMDKITILKQEWKSRPIAELQKHMARKWPMFVW